MNSPVPQFEESETRAISQWVSDCCILFIQMNRNEFFKASALEWLKGQIERIKKRLNDNRIFILSADGKMMYFTTYLNEDGKVEMYVIHESNTKPRDEEDTAIRTLQDFYLICQQLTK